ncbi:hypothetical protein [Butyrivibrio sp. NC3005]|uniref:hypothetical protein n=1 Tax=Butyrivibrio sp. NC3005 TaxID=1280685 RepID=UPI000409B06E|nr:hypothetical protein [Butyrivibrio sp. NC3005]
MASEMMLAKDLNENGSIISKTWYYSTELRVFCQQWFLRIGLLFYPDNWHRARIIGGLLMIMVTVLISYIFLIMAGCRREYAAFGAGIMAWPFGREYYFYAIWGLYYLSHIILAMILISLFISCYKKIETKGTFKLQIMLCLLVSFLCGLNGIRLIYSVFVPLVLTCLILVFFDKEKKSLKKLYLSMLMLILGGAGMIFNEMVLTKNYHFCTFDFISCYSEFPRSIEDLLRDYFCYFGYQPGANIFNFIGIASVVGILFGIIVFFCSIRLLLYLKNSILINRRWWHITILRFGFIY